MLQSLPKGIRHRISSHFLDPSTVVGDLDIRTGNKVLEIGLPIGFFAPALLNRVGPDGMVYVAIKSLLINWAIWLSKKTWHSSY